METLWSPPEQAKSFESATAGFNPSLYLSLLWTAPSSASNETFGTNADPIQSRTSPSGTAPGPCVPTGRPGFRSAGAGPLDQAFRLTNNGLWWSRRAGMRQAAF